MCLTAWTVFEVLREELLEFPYLPYDSWQNINVMECIMRQSSRSNSAIQEEFIHQLNPFKSRYHQKNGNILLSLAKAPTSQGNALLNSRKGSIEGDLHANYTNQSFAGKKMFKSCSNKTQISGGDSGFWILGMTKIENWINKWVQ